MRFTVHINKGTSLKCLSHRIINDRINDFVGGESPFDSIQLALFPSVSELPEHAHLTRQSLLSLEFR